MLINRRLAAILMLGFSSGLPLILIGATLQAWYTEAGIGIMAIGALSLVGLPYTLKFLWAPMLDHFSFRWLGKRRGWIFILQISLCIAFIILANMDPHQQAMQMGILALAIACLSATQDVAIDAYRTEVLLPEERGLGASYYVFSWRMAALVAGGLGLILAAYIGWKLTYELMGFFMLASSMATYFAPETQELLPSKNFLTAVVDPFINFLNRDNLMLIILFVIFYKLGDALATSLLSNFLLRGLGFSLTQVGLVYKTISIVGVISGAFIGGIMLMKRSLYSALLWFGLAQAFSTLLFALLAMVGKDFTLMTFSLFIENFCSGMSTAAFMAFLMSLCDKRYTATQYAFLSAIASIGRVLLGPLAAIMVERLGWTQFYIWSFALTFPGIVFLFFLKNEVFMYADVVAD